MAYALLWAYLSLWPQLDRSPTHTVLASLEANRMQKLSAKEDLDYVSMHVQQSGVVMEEMCGNV